MKDFGARLRQLRMSRGMSIRELAVLCETSKSSISMYESGERRPKYETLEAIADVFNVDMEYLLGKTDVKNRAASELGFDSLEEAYTSKTRLQDFFGKSSPLRVPVLGKVAAGIPIEAIEEILDYEELSPDMARDGSEYFALQIKGTSMEPKISDGDVVIVRKQPDVDSGQIAIVCVNGDEATCKKIMKQNTGILLLPLNPIFAPTFYSNEDIERIPITILGRVIELRAKF